MIGKKIKLSVKMAELTEKFPCYRFGTGQGDNILWALYKLDAPDFCASSPNGDADVFLLTQMYDGGWVRHYCISAGDNAFGKEIPPEIASVYDGKAARLIRKTIEDAENCAKYDETIMASDCNVDYDFYANALRDMLKRMF